MFHLECNKRVQEIDPNGIRRRDKDRSLRAVLPTTIMRPMLEISTTKVQLNYYTVKYEICRKLIKLFTNFVLFSRALS